MPRITAREGATRPLAAQSPSLVSLPSFSSHLNSFRPVQPVRCRGLRSRDVHSVASFLLSLVCTFAPTLLSLLSLMTYNNTQPVQASTAVPCCYHNRKTLVAPSLTHSLTRSLARSLCSTPSSLSSRQFQTTAPCFFCSDWVTSISYL